MTARAPQTPAVKPTARRYSGDSAQESREADRHRKTTHYRSSIQKEHVQEVPGNGASTIRRSAAPVRSSSATWARARSKGSSAHSSGLPASGYASPGSHRSEERRAGKERRAL